MLINVGLPKSVDSAFFCTGVHLSVSGGKAQGGVNSTQVITGNFTYNTWTHVALQYNNETQEQVS